MAVRRLPGSADAASADSAAHAFVEESYRAYGHSVLRRTRALLGNEADATEAVHEIFLALLERPEQFEHRSALPTWLYQTTTNLCLNRLRNQRTRSRILSRQTGDFPASAPGNAEPFVLVRQLLKQLPDALALAAIYHYLDEMTQDEIAETMGCSRRQVGKLLQKARALLRTEELTL